MKSHYLRCCDCGWQSEAGATNETCPKCNVGFLIKKPTIQAANNVKRARLNKSRPKSTEKSLKEVDGYKLHRNPKGKGWVFIEGRSQRDAPVFLSNEDARKINACALRRGLIRSPRVMGK